MTADTPTEGRRVCPKCEGEMLGTMDDDDGDGTLLSYDVCLKCGYECGHEEKVK